MAIDAPGRVRKLALLEPEIDTVLIPCASHDLPGRNPVAVASGLAEFFAARSRQKISFLTLDPPWSAI